MTEVYQSVQGNGIGGHHSHKMGTDTWLTPRFILDALGEFDLDPCSAPDPALWSTAQRHYTLPTDGLAQPWEGRVWLNPPYGQLGWPWLQRLAEHGRGTALIFARTETAGFVKHIWKRADAVMFLHGRLYFHHADGTRAAANSGGPSCLVAYGVDDAVRLMNSGLSGTFTLWDKGLADSPAEACDHVLPPVTVTIQHTDTPHDQPAGNYVNCRHQYTCSNCGRVPE